MWSQQPEKLLEALGRAPSSSASSWRIGAHPGKTGVDLKLWEVPADTGVVSRGRRGAERTSASRGVGLLPVYMKWSISAAPCPQRQSVRRPQHRGSCACVARTPASGRTPEPSGREMALLVED